MKFTIITPTHKRPFSLSRCINSVLNQTYPNYEMLICSDGKDDLVESIIKEYDDDRLKYLYVNESNDMGATPRNHSIGISKGDYIIYLDDDNIIYPNFLEILNNNINDNIGMIVHKTYNCLVNGVIPKNNKISHGDIDILSVCIRKDIASSIKWDNIYEHDFIFIKSCESIINYIGLEIKYIDDLIGEHLQCIEYTNKNNFKNHIYHNIDGWFDFQKLYRYAINEFKDGSHFVELGAWMGKSTSFMAIEIANSGKNIKFDAIDTWNGSINENLHKDIINNLNETLYNKFLNNISCVSDYINPIKGYTYNVVNNYEDKSLDFIFIDASHDYESVKKDIVDWYPKLKDNGIIAGHDYNIKNWPGVVKAVNEFFGEENVILFKKDTISWMVKNISIKNKLEKSSYPKICLISPCYNEEEILPFYLDYYINFVKVDKIVIYDGGSNDNTPNIIKEYDNVEFIVDKTDKMDERTLTDIRNNGWKKYKDLYDWIIVCDIDEFIYHPDLKNKLIEYDKDGITIPLIDGYDMISEDFPEFQKGKYLTKIIKNGVKDPEYLNKNALFNGKKININYEFGTHSCNPSGNVVYSENSEIKLLQYKWLSYEYLIKKSYNSSERLSVWNIEKGAGKHYDFYSKIHRADFHKRFISSTNVIDYNINFNCDNYIGNEEELKIQRLDFLQYFLDNENNIPTTVDYIDNNILYNKKITLENISDKAYLLINYLLEDGYKRNNNVFIKPVKKPIYLFGHNYLINEWEYILIEQLNKIKFSGLYKNSNLIFMCGYGDDDEWRNFINIINNYDVDKKIITIKHKDNFYEYYTLQYMWDFCQNISESYILYFHLKGVWSLNNLQTGDNDELNINKPLKNRKAIIKWKDCMEYFNIERWYKCIDKLNENYDVVGALYNYNEECPIFTGNFWWANSNYIKKLNRISYKIEEERYSSKLWCRVKCEKWINTIKNNIYNFYTPKDLNTYRYEIDPSDYRDDMNPLISIITSTYKKYEELKNAINSVLNQTYNNWEMLICSDGYDKLTESIVNNYNNNKIRYFSTERSNDYGSTQKNYLTKISNGKYLIYLDDDNIIYPECLKTIVNNFDSSNSMIIFRIDYDGLDEPLPNENKLKLGKVDTLCLSIDKYYTNKAIWKNYAGQDYEFIKICENNISSYGKKLKFIPYILGRHISKKINNSMTNKKIVYSITSHPNFKMSEDITLKCLNQIKSFGEKIILTSHCPVSPEIQSSIDYLIYDKNNPIINHDFFTKSWFNTDEYYAILNITKNGNNTNHALGVYLNYYNSILLAKQQGFDIAVCTNFDMVFSHTDKKVIDDIIKEMISENKKAFFMNTPEREGIHYKTIFFITEIDYFLNKFKYFLNEESYKNELNEIGSNTNCLENFFYHNLKDESNILLLKEINENDLFPNSEINLFSLIEYYTILPLENDPNKFVIWFSSANSLDDRNLKLSVIKNDKIILDEIKNIDKQFVYFKDFEFKEGDQYKIIFNIFTNGDILKTKEIIVDDNIFKNINEYGKFIKK